MDIQVKKPKAPMILGVSSLIAWIIPAIGLIVSIAGIIISSKRLKEDNCKAYKIGRILSIVGIVLSVAYFAILYYIQVSLMV